MEFRVQVFGTYGGRAFDSWSCVAEISEESMRAGAGHFRTRAEADACAAELQCIYWNTLTQFRVVEVSTEVCS